MTADEPLPHTEPTELAPLTLEDRATLAPLALLLASLAVSLVALVLSFIAVLD